MSDYQAKKPQPSENLESIAEFLSEQPETLDRDFWKEYFYWSWRCLLFVFFIVLVMNIDLSEPPTRWFDDVNVIMWIVLMVSAFLVGPLVVTGWSFLWMWGQDLVERFRR